MTREQRRYARFYYPEFIRDYPHIWEDAEAFHSWMRLLVVAESMWPAAPDLPRTIRTRALAKLTACGLVATAGRTYVIKGLHAERTARSTAASNAARSRWRSADGNAQEEEEEKKRTNAERDTNPVENGRARLDLVKPLGTGR